MAGSGAPLQRVGMFGGAFDPPHTAHRALAQAALEQLQLDALHVMPTGQAWHKARALSPAHHRIAMCERAFGDLPRVRIDRREPERLGPRYPADTLEELRAEYPQATLYLVLGADQLLAFKSWVRWEEVCRWHRPEQARWRQALRGDALIDLQRVDTTFGAAAQCRCSTSARTALRAKLATDRPGTAAGPGDLDAVASYISQHHLYQTAS